MSQITNLIRPGAIPPPSGYVQTLTGNVGPAIPPDGAGNIDILTANSTPVFTGSGNQLQVDFGLSNLLLGSPGLSITFGDFNTGIGLSALDALSAGNHCTAIGAYSLTSNDTGSENTGVGYNALGQIPSGTGNIALGANAGSFLDTTDSNNILIGNTGTGGQNSQINIGTIGTHTTFFTAGIASVAVSNKEYVSIDTTTGQLGSDSGPGAGTITGNAGGPISQSAGNWDILTADSTIIFNGSGSALTLDFAPSSGNIMLGSSGPSIAGGVANTGLGLLALDSVSTANNCTALGRDALMALQTQDDCTAVGAFALASSNGTQNTALGVGALGGITNGVINLGLGHNAGGNLSGAESNNIMIANPGVVGDSAQIRIGVSGTHSGCFIAGIASVVVSNKEYVTIDTTNGQLGSDSGPGAGTITGNTGGAISQSTGNWNIVTSGTNLGFEAVSAKIIL